MSIAILNCTTISSSYGCLSSVLPLYESCTGSLLGAQERVILPYIYMHFNQSCLYLLRLDKFGSVQTLRGFYLCSNSSVHNESCSVYSCVIPLLFIQRWNLAFALWARHRAELGTITSVLSDLPLEMIYGTSVLPALFSLNVLMFLFFPCC